MADGPERLAAWNEARTAERLRLEALVEAGVTDPKEYEPPGWREPTKRAPIAFDVHDLEVMRKRRRQEAAAGQQAAPRREEAAAGRGDAPLS